MLKFLRSSKAFSLIEILLVLFILAFVMAFAAQRLYRPQKKVREAFNKMIRLNRRLATLSQLHGQTYRWALQLNKEGPDQYWVEKKQKQAKALKRSGAELEPLKTSPQSSEFAMDKSFYPEPETLPAFLDMAEWESASEAKTEGLAYIYYYPKGLAQETAIHLIRPDNQGRWTLYLDPVSKSIQLIKGRRGLDPKGGLKPD